MLGTPLFRGLVRTGLACPEGLLHEIGKTCRGSLPVLARFGDGLAERERSAIEQVLPGVRLGRVLARLASLAPSGLDSCSLDWGNLDSG